MHLPWVCAGNTERVLRARWLRAAGATGDAEGSAHYESAPWGVFTLPTPIPCDLVRRHGHSRYVLYYSPDYHTADTSENHLSPLSLLSRVVSRPHHCAFHWIFSLCQPPQDRGSSPSPRKRPAKAGQAPTARGSSSTTRNGGRKTMNTRMRSGCCV